MYIYNRVSVCSLYVCSGYEVQFHILTEHIQHSHGQLDLPKELTQPKGLLSSAEAASSSTHSVPFSLTFTSLPSSLTLSDSLLQGAVRSGTTYSIITAAYTENYEQEVFILKGSLSF